MAFDIEAIRRKLETLNGKKTYISTWKPKKADTYRIRVLPWPAKMLVEGTPFIERYFYWLGEESVLAPKQFGESDPVEELAAQLWKSKKQSDKDAAKKLFPKMSAYIAILVKGEEDQGPQLMKLSHPLYKRLLGFLLDEDIGDFIDIENGLDLKVTASDNNRRFKGKVQLDLTIDPGKSSHLNKWFGGDNDKMLEALNNLPSVDEHLKGQRKSAAEIKLILDKWLAGDEGEEDPKEGVTRNAQATSNELDELVAEVKSTTAAPVKSKAALDAAFDDLMNDE
jgi:hypothetical protein